MMNPLERFERLIMNISTQLIQTSAYQVDIQIEEALGLMGSFFNADRSYVFLFNHYLGNTEEGPETMHNTHEWCQEGIEPQKEMLQYLPLDIFPWWIDHVQKNRMIHIPQVKDMPEEASAEKEILEAQSVLSLIVVPLVLEKRSIGFIGFDFVHNPAEVETAVVSTLRIVGQLFVNAFERKRYEEELQKERDFALHIMRTISQGLTVTNERLQFTYVNPAFSELVGFSQEELLGKSPSDVTDEKTAPVSQNQLQKRLAGRGSTYEVTLVHKSGESIPVMISGVPQFKKGQYQGSIAIVTDLRQVKKLEDSLRDARDQALEAARAKSQFLATMSHEIRTPMNAILGFAQILEQDHTLSPQQKKAVLTILRSGEHLLALINDILDLSKIESGKVSLHPTVFDLHRLFEDLEAMFRPRLASKSLQLIMDQEEGIPRFVRADEGKLRQILVNLLSNAVKFTDQGGIAVRWGLREILNPENPMIFRLIVEVEDSGSGIDTTSKERIFDPFHQAEAGIKAGGTGLGLAITRSYIQMMNGTISVSSTPEKGSCFRFEIMMERAEESALMLTGNKRVVGFKHLHPELRVLVADDHEPNRDFLKDLLEPTGIEVVEACNGKEALERFEKDRPHLILMDMRMPIMDGYEATRRIKSTKRGKHTPIIAVTASAFEDARENVMKCGVDDYIRKPLRASELFEAVGKLLSLEYRLEGDRDATDETEKDIPKPAFSIPPDLITQAKEALEEGDMAHLSDAVDQIAQFDDLLAKDLHRFIEEYNHDEIRTLLEKRSGV